eukprot:395244_1
MSYRHTWPPTNASYFQEPTDFVKTIQAHQENRLPYPFPFNWFQGVPVSILYTIKHEAQYTPPFRFETDKALVERHHKFLSNLSTDDLCGRFGFKAKDLCTLTYNQKRAHILNNKSLVAIDTNTTQQLVSTYLIHSTCTAREREDLFSGENGSDYLFLPRLRLKLINNELTKRGVKDSYLVSNAPHPDLQRHLLINSWIRDPDPIVSFLLRRYIEPQLRKHIPREIKALVSIYIKESVDQQKKDWKATQQCIKDENSAIDAQLYSQSVEER